MYAGELLKKPGFDAGCRAVVEGVGGGGEEKEE
jgi:hypothetical protein